MADIDELYTKAKEKLQLENFQHGTPQDAIRSMCLEWLEWAVVNDSRAVELLAVVQRTPPAPTRRWKPLPAKRSVPATV